MFQVASGVRSTVGTTVALLRPYRLAAEERVDETCELRDVKKVMLPSSALAAAETNLPFHSSASLCSLGRMLACGSMSVSDATFKPAFWHLRISLSE